MLFAQRVPRVEASIGAGDNDSVNVADFTAQLGVQGYVWINSVHAEPITIDSFSLLVMRDTSIVFSRKNVSAYFNEGVKKFLKLLKAGDKILVYDIYTTLYRHTILNEQKRLVSPLEYFIK